MLRPASLHEHDVLQTASGVGSAAEADPVRTALVIASLCATVAVGCVALKAFFSNHQEVISIQAPR